MANKIRLDGTTANSFQIGTSGYAIASSNTGTPGQVLGVDNNSAVKYMPGFTNLNLPISVSVPFYAGNPDSVLQAGLAISFNTSEEAENFINDTSTSFIFDDGLGDSISSTNTKWQLVGVTQKYLPFAENPTYVQVVWDSSTNIGPATTPGENIVTYNTAGISPTSLTASVANVHITGGYTDSVLFNDSTGNLQFGLGFTQQSTSTTTLSVYTWVGSPDFNAGQGLALVFNNPSDAIIFANDTSSSFTLYAAGDNFTIWQENGVTDRTIDPNNTNSVQITWSSSTNMGTFSAPDNSYNSVLLNTGTTCLSPTTLTASVANVHITGGEIGQVLSTDGTGNVSWANAGGTPAEITLSATTGIPRDDANATILYGNISIENKFSNVTVQVNNLDPITQEWVQTPVTGNTTITTSIIPSDDFWPGVEYSGSPEEGTQTAQFVDKQSKFYLPGYTIFQPGLVLQTSDSEGRTWWGPAPIGYNGSINSPAPSLSDDALATTNGRGWSCDGLVLDGAQYLSAGTIRLFFPSDIEAQQFMDSFGWNPSLLEGIHLFDAVSQYSINIGVVAQNLNWVQWETGPIVYFDILFSWLSANPEELAPITATVVTVDTKTIAAGRLNAKLDDINIAGGSEGQVLTTNGSGILSWTTPGQGLNAIAFSNGSGNLDESMSYYLQYYDEVYYDITGDATFTFTNLPANNFPTGKKWSIILTFKTSGNTVTFPTNTHWPNNTVPTWSSSSYDTVEFVSFNNGSHWVARILGMGYSNFNVG